MTNEEDSAEPVEKNEPITSDDSDTLKQDENTVDSLKKKLESAYGSQETLKEKYLRSLAELENIRKRSVRDREESIIRTRRQILEDLLPALDAFKLGLAESLKTDPDGVLVKGFVMAVDQLESILGEYGLMPIDPVGELFDPLFHEAISYELAKEDGVVLKTIRTGYKIKEQVIRPSSVIVSKAQ